MLRYFSKLLLELLIDDKADQLKKLSCAPAVRLIRVEAYDTSTGTNHAVDHLQDALQHIRCACAIVPVATDNHCVDGAR